VIWGLAIQLLNDTIVIFLIAMGAIFVGRKLSFLVVDFLAMR
jgi:hypothetical protein